MKKIKISTIGLIVGFAVILRLIAVNQSLWLDEAINVIAARDRSFTNLLFIYTIGDFHPPLFHAILWNWFRIFPSTEIFARIPSVIFGVSTVFVTYKIAKLLANSKDSNDQIANLAPLFLATSGLHIYYSQEARMYALAAFLTTLTFFALFKLRKQPSLRNKLLYFGSLILMLLSDYQPWLLLPLFFLLQPGFTSLAALLTLPWWPTLVRQLERGLATAGAIPLWGEIVGKLTLKSALLVPLKFLVGRTSIDNNFIFASLIAMPLIVVFASLLKTINDKTKAIRILQGWLIIPFIVAAIVSIKIPVFSYFRFIFTLPALYILLAVGLVRLPLQWRKAAIALILTTNLISSAAYLGIGKFHRENWRAATGFMHQSSPQQSLVLFPNLAQAAGFEYYNAGKLPVQDKETLNLDKKYQNLFLVRYMNEAFDPQEQLSEALRQAGFRRIKEAGFNGVLVWHYELEKSE